MGTTNTQWPGWAPSGLNVELVDVASEALSVGDLCYWDTTQLAARAVSKMTDLGSAIAMQAAVAQVFLGVSNGQRLATDTVSRAHPIIIDQIFDFTCASSTFNPGDLLGINSTAGSPGALNDQTLVKVADPRLAIGKVVKRYSTATTTVKCRLISRYLAFGSPVDDYYTQLSAQQPWANFRNTIDGGDFTTNPWQRGTTFSAIANTLTYTADRFFAVGGSSSSISVSQQAQTDVAGFGNSLRWGRGGGTNTATINLGQVLETLDCVRFQGRLVTLSFWAKAGAQFSATNSALTVQLNHSTTAGNDTAAHLVAASTNWQAVPTIINGTATLTATAQRFTFTGVVPATATQLGLLFSYAPTGTNNSTDTVDFYGIQLEEGPVATPFEHRDIEVELALAQRYYFRATEVNGATFAIGAPSGSNTQTYSLWLPTPMRAAPTVTWTVGGFKLIIDGASAASPTTPAAGSAHSPNIITLTTANTLSAAAHSVALTGTGTTGFIDASAEF